MDFENVEQSANFIDELAYKKAQPYLTDIQKLVLKESIRDKTYAKMAEDNGYSECYCRVDVGSKLWVLLTKILGEEVSKNNFKEAFKRAWLQYNQPNQPRRFNFPEGALTSKSSFYVDRHPIENICYQTIIEEPGALLRIKGVKQMGKTSLIRRILAHAKEQNYLTVYFNLRLIDTEKFETARDFLRSFYLAISRKFPSAPPLEKWDNETPVTISCTDQFQLLLEELNQKIVLALDEIDILFDYPDIYQKFFPMLRSWHQEAGEGEIEIWENLRLIIAHSTEDYGRLDINQSPFNVGIPIDLPRFNLEQINNLAKVYQLPSMDLEGLMSLTGRHPFLIHLALYKLASSDVTLEELLQDAATDAGIYNTHVRRLLKILQKNENLGTIYRDIINSDKPLTFANQTKELFQLDSIGLIKRNGNLVMPLCELYRLYFREKLTV